MIGDSLDMAGDAILEGSRDAYVFLYELWTEDGVKYSVRPAE